jgi:adenosylmethionine-8-amino-7-oxononanoate aminotransferase
MERSLQEMAKQHLMLHFSDMSVGADEITVIDHGEGYYVFDTEGNRYIDGLSGLYCANLGHSHGDEIGRVAHEQMAKLPFTSNWTVAHPSSIEAAARIADLAPAGLDRVFFTSGGSEAVEAAWKIAVQWHAANGQPQRRKVIARRDAYHGVTMGALSFTGMPVCRTPFEPMPIPTHHVAATNAYRHPAGADEAALCRALLDEIEEAIEFEVAETIAMIIAEPVQNAGGCFVPPDGYWQGLREICDRHGILLVSDEVICAWGRIGTWFGGQRFGYTPDLITFAKGVTAGHFAFGGMIISDKVAEPFLSGAESYMHGYTFGGHPVGSAVALATIDILEREEIPQRVRGNEEHARARLEQLLEIPIVGDVRGCGHFFALELVRDQESKETLEGPVAEWLLKDVLTKRLYENGLICRLDDRADPIVQIAPPLIGGTEMFDEITEILRDGLEHAAERIDERPPAAVTA